MSQSMEATHSIQDPLAGTSTSITRLGISNTHEISKMHPEIPENAICRASRRPRPPPPVLPSGRRRCVAGPVASSPPPPICHDHAEPQNSHTQGRGMVTEKPLEQSIRVSRLMERVWVRCAPGALRNRSSSRRSHDGTTRGTAAGRRGGAGSSR